MTRSPIRSLARLALAHLALSALLATPAAAQCTTDDAFEDNDDCASAVVLPTGFWSALNVHPSGSPLGPDADYFKLEDVPPGHYAHIETIAFSGFGELSVTVFDDAACTSVVDRDDVRDIEKCLYAVNATAAPKDFWVLFESHPQNPYACARFDVNLTYLPTPCAAVLDDAFEPNDACGAAALLDDGLTAPLTITNGDVDCFEVVVQDGETLYVDAFYGVPFGTLDLELFTDVTCTVSAHDPAFDGFGPGVESVGVTNATGAARSYYLRASFPSGGCVEYRLFVHLGASECPTAAGDDALEENDDCGAPAWIAPGSHGALVVRGDDPDYYKLTVPGLARLRLQLDYAPNDADVRVRVLEANCGPNLYGAVGFFGELEIDWTNLDPAPRDVVIEVGFPFANFPLDVAPCVPAFEPFRCFEYDLDLRVDAVNAGAPGFCFADGAVPCPCGNDAGAAPTGCVNSTGEGALLLPYGSSSVATDDLFFRLEGFPPFQTGVLFEGTAAIAQPFRDGLLCVGGFVTRVERMANGVNSWFTATSMVDNSTHPVPGDTRYFQFWYRDPGGSVCGTGSNLSNGVQVFWQ